MSSKNEVLNKNYSHYIDYTFKTILLERANGLLKFIGIPYHVVSVILSEYTSLGPTISRMDFAGDAIKEGKTICLILECQSKLPNDDDIKRFFQYVSSLRIFKNNNVELYILCTKKAHYDKKEFVINDECSFIMHIISLKEFKASDIFKNIENKLENNEKITEEDIASLQVIVYTDYVESELDILINARKLLERIAVASEMDINEKNSIIYLFDVLSVNMLDDDEFNEYEEETYMLLNPTDRYLEAKGKREGIIEGKREGIIEGKREMAVKMIEAGHPIEYVMELSGLSKNDISNAK